MKRIYNIMATAATALLLSLTSCSSSSDSPVVDELANISKFQEMTNDTHVIELYSHLGGLQQGYNEISIRIKDKTTGNYIKNASVTWQPLMHMNMMTHACPYSEVEKVTPSGTLYEGYIVFQMAQNATEYWDLQINYTIDGTDYTAKDVIDVPASTDRRVNSFTGTDGVKYIVAYAEPHHPKVAVNDIIVGIFKMQDMMHFPVADGYSLEIDPRMPSMGNHGSPNNVAATQTAPGELYIGKMSLTMTGYWKINLKLISPEGTVLKGESITDTVTESSLYFDFEF
ncbi:hypothetical protein [Flavobacterium silvisoli]|nr:hypothetical protein [Flavobacterium silvisoli]